MAANIYTINYSSNNVTKITPSSYPAPPAKPAAPSAVVGPAGSGSATVTVPANATSAIYGGPSSYTVSAVQDSSKHCTVRYWHYSCTISGLSIGTAYRFTAKASLATWTTAASAASGSVTPLAPSVTPPAPPSKPAKPAKPAVTWSSAKKTKTVTAVITPISGVTYTLTAKNGSKTKLGSCKNVTVKRGKKRVARRSCTIKLAKGKWLVSVTPTKSKLKGTANSKSYRF